MFHRNVRTNYLTTVLIEMTTRIKAVIKFSAHYLFLTNNSIIFDEEMFVIEKKTKNFDNCVSPQEDGKGISSRCNVTEIDVWYRATILLKIVEMLA